MCHCVNPEPMICKTFYDDESLWVQHQNGWSLTLWGMGTLLGTMVLSCSDLLWLENVCVRWSLWVCDEDGIWCQYQASRWGHRSVIICIQLLFTYTLINISWRDRRTTGIDWRSTMTYHQWDYPCWDLVYSVTLVLPPRHDFHGGDTEGMWWVCKAP